MEKAIDTRTKLLTKNPFSLMLELSIPAILGMVVVGLYNMMDSIFIGQMVGAALQCGFCGNVRSWICFCVIQGDWKER